MNKWTFLKVLALGFFAFSTALQITGCANIVPPGGGPKDSLPPYLVAAKPHDSSLNIQPKEILIAFNEFIVSSSIQENLVISPSLKMVPGIKDGRHFTQLNFPNSVSNTSRPSNFIF